MKYFGTSWLAREISESITMTSQGTSRLSFFSKGDMQISTKFAYLLPITFLKAGFSKVEVWMCFFPEKNALPKKKKGGFRGFSKKGFSQKTASRLLSLSKKPSEDMQISTEFAYIFSRTKNNKKAP